MKNFFDYSGNTEIFILERFMPPQFIINVLVCKLENAYYTLGIFVPTGYKMDTITCTYETGAIALFKTRTRRSILTTLRRYMYKK